jgi:hypothetical protein
MSAAMADPNAFLHDPRRRNLAVLAVVALVMVGLAAWALQYQASLVAPKYPVETFFPGLADEARNVARIHIESQKYGALDIAFKPSAGWVLPAQHDYPADFNQVRTTIVGMSGLETIQPETARKDWLNYLGLGAPAKHGSGTLIALIDEHGRVLASMIAGKTKDIGDPGGSLGLFVRKTDSDQSWLLRSVFSPTADPKDWMNKEVIDIAQARIQEADVSPPTGPAYTVRREKPSDPDFTLVNMPKGRDISYPSAPDGVAGGLVGFSFDDVAPASTIDFGDAARLVTKTFDGLTVIADVAKKDDKYWVRLYAQATPGKTDAEDEARKITKAAAGWAFQIPAYKGAQLTSTLESLLKPQEKGPAKAAKPKR